MSRLYLRNATLEAPLGVFVMGIVNATADSFWPESRGGLERAQKLIAEGADILDIGGESSRPGSAYVSAEEEIRRVVPLVRAIRRISDIPLSIDTRKAAVMQAAFAEGADIVNDISALEDDDALLPFAAKTGIPVILMHKRGTPLTMQVDTAYRDVFSDVDDYLSARADFALRHGIQAEKIIVDPGIGFGKDAAGNAALIASSGKLCGGRYPTLIGLSRKSFIGTITNSETAERLIGTVTANLLAVQNGARIIRVHDVKETVDSLKVFRYISLHTERKEAEVSRSAF